MIENGAKIRTGSPHVFFMGVWKLSALCFPGVAPQTLILLTVIILLLFFWPRRAACRILVPRPGIEPVAPAVEARSLNHWTAREVP